MSPTFPRSKPRWSAPPPGPVAVELAAFFHELRWLLHRGAKFHLDFESEEREPDGFDEPGDDISIKLTDEEGWKADIAYVESIRGDAHKALDNAWSYVGQLNGAVMKEWGPGEIDCEDITKIHNQAQLWATQALKYIGALHATIARINTHFIFIHECPPDPECDPIDPEDAETGTEIRKNLPAKVDKSARKEQAQRTAKDKAAR